MYIKWLLTYSNKAAILKRLTPCDVTRADTFIHIHQKTIHTIFPKNNEVLPYFTNKLDFSSSFYHKT